MKNRTSLALIVLAGFFSIPAWAVQSPTPTIDLAKICPAYLSGGFSPEAQEKIKQLGINLPTACKALSADRNNDWVLIITPTNQPASYVPGFTSEVACVQAVNIWQGRDRSEGDRPGHAVCVEL